MTTHAAAASNAAEPSNTPTAAEAPVLVSRTGALTRITLNRPAVINALTVPMLHSITAGLTAAQADGSSAILLDGAGERGFCGGGDIKRMAGDGPALAEEFLRTEYRTDYAVHVSPVPVVGVMDGITMGGGIGLTGHAAIRIVTERSRLAMPEVRIGIVPDVGGHRLLARAPGRLGELLAITAGSMTAGDALALGFADYFVPSTRIGQLSQRLAAGDDPALAVEALAEPAPESMLLRAREWFDPIADEALADEHRAPVEAAVLLLRALERGGEAARETARTVRLMCPTAVVVTIAQLRHTRDEGLTLAEVLDDDLRLLPRLMQRDDFLEGVRAAVIDKDGQPGWKPARIEDVSEDRVARILAPADPGSARFRLV
ncbi:MULTISPECIES: enoyl-CoA hydratase/isomerase family protein [unclassified Leucobacter]|uniref:enoyl-CoA hydratase/isomerase family protein n=1 Tax=unclassified Leucobacter TaxID=2621730 RepID=UPI00165EB6B9|nr:MULTISPECIES: enoyl-CoA hydratase/isomerase family protein [unclassified Leucobacter]MBC9937133.1 enoyl-CoA hydratase/isomerase family protein [Leucobacter sp. cx-87]